MPDVPGPTIITPIKATIHWDDLQQRWKLKATRQEQEAGQTIPWAEVLEDVLTLAQLIQLLLDYWAGQGSVVAATLGDMIALQNYLAGINWTLLQTDVPRYESSVTFPGSDYTSPPYDGAHDDWGVTAP